MSEQPSSYQGKASLPRQDTDGGEVSSNAPSYGTTQTHTAGETQFTEHGPDMAGDGIQSSAKWTETAGTGPWGDEWTKGFVGRAPRRPSDTVSEAQATEEIFASDPAPPFMPPAEVQSNAHSTEPDFFPSKPPYVLPYAYTGTGVSEIGLGGVGRRLAIAEGPNAEEKAYLAKIQREGNQDKATADGQDMAETVQS
ncbi:hypothetical protein IAT40_006523 [Kwoniella sp. CBS 6097]